MTLNLPENSNEILNRSRSDVQNELPKINPFIRNSFLSAILVAHAGRSFDFSIQQNILIDELFMDTSTGEFLERWGSYKQITRNPATQAQGNITITGIVASVVPISAILTSSDDEQYETQESKAIATEVESVFGMIRVGTTVTVTTDNNHQFSSGNTVTIAGAIETEYNGDFEIIVTGQNSFTYEIVGSPSTPATGTITASADLVTILVKSIGFGSDTNRNNGDTLNFNTPVAGVDNATTVQFDGISGGTDIESDEDLRSRILDAYQNPIALFNVAQIINQARLVSGVTRVFVKEITPLPGQVTVFFTRDNDDDIIPSAQEVIDVKTSLLLIKPSTMSDDDVIVSAPTPVATNFIFSSILPNTQTMKDSVTLSLEQFFKQSTTVGKVVQDFSYISAIGNTVDTETGEKIKDFSLATPIGAIIVNVGDLATLGSVSF